MTMEQARLTELVASKMCHDFLGPITALTQGLDMIRDSSPAQREEGMSLLEAGIAKAQSKFEFYRYALGGSFPEGDLKLSSAKSAAEAAFQTCKAQLVWAQTDITLPRAAMRVVLNMLMIGNDCLAKGGSVTLYASPGEVTVVAAGERARMRQEISDGLRGHFSEDGFQSMFIQPFLTSLLARQAGVELMAREAEGAIELVMKSAHFKA
jgi:histidine phosphotransferase ChpT